MIIDLLIENKHIICALGNLYYKIIDSKDMFINTLKYHVFAPMGRLQLELIYLYSPPSFHLTVGCFCPVGLSVL